jgi:hypothetical protein
LENGVAKTAVSGDTKDTTLILDKCIDLLSRIWNDCDPFYQPHLDEIAELLEEFESKYGEDTGRSIN